MEKCVTCKFWSPPTAEYQQGFGYCDRLSDAAPEEQLAYTTDYEGYQSTLRTRAEFGCVEHAMDAALA